MNMKDTMAFSIDKERADYHFRKKRRKVIKLFISLFLWLLLVIYLITPFATYKMMHVKGNVYLTEREIIELAGIKNTWWWLVDSQKLKDKLEEQENIDNVSISKNIYGLSISILEKYPLAIKDDKYLMNTTLELLDRENYKYKIDNLVDISDIDDAYLNVFANQYIHVDLKIRNVFTKASMQDDKIIIFEGHFDENSYFEMKLNIDCLSIKLSGDNFYKIKNEILGKVVNDNVKYNQGNPCIVEYNFTNVYEYRIG